MNMISQLDEKQISALRALHFWRRNLIVASRQQDSIECHKSRIAIVHLFKYCDHLEIPYRLQNKVIYAALKDVAFSDLLI